MSNQSYVQVAPDGSGRRIANFAVALPAGTAVTDSDGVVSYLSAETTVFLQRVAIADSEGNIIEDFVGDDRQGEIISELRELRRVFCRSTDQLFVDPPEDIS